MTTQNTFTYTEATDETDGPVANIRLVNLDTTGTLAFGFGRTSGKNYLYCNSSYNTAPAKWTNTKQNTVPTNGRSVTKTSSYTGTDLLVVYYVTDDDTSVDYINYFTLDSNGSYSTRQILYLDINIYGLCLHIKSNGKFLAIGCDDKFLLVCAPTVLHEESDKIILKNDFTSKILYVSNTCDEEDPYNHGLILTEDNSLYVYYTNLNNDTLYTLNFSNTKYKAMSNIFFDSAQNTCVFLLDTSNTKKMYLCNITFDRESTILSSRRQQQDGSYNYDYTSLIAYDENNFLFTTTTYFIYKLLGKYASKNGNKFLPNGAMSAVTEEDVIDAATGATTGILPIVQMCVSDDTTSIWTYTS
jgi:hypothetical protein